MDIPTLRKRRPLQNDKEQLPAFRDQDLSEAPNITQNLVQDGRPVLVFDQLIKVQRKCDVARLPRQLRVG